MKERRRMESSLLGKIKESLKKRELLRKILKRLWRITKMGRRGGWQLRIEDEEVPRLIQRGEMPRKLQERIHSLVEDGLERVTLKAFEREVAGRAGPGAHLASGLIFRTMNTANGLLRKNKVAEAIDFLQDEYRKARDAKIIFAICEIVTFINSIDASVVDMNTPEGLLKLIANHYLPARLKLAEIYEKRGQIDEAVSLWTISKERLSSLEYSFMLQTMLKSPTVSSKTLLEEQSEWARRFIISPISGEVQRMRRWDGKKKLRIGYHCSFWNTLCARYQLMAFIRHHDKSRFEIVCYSPDSVPETISKHFEEVRVVADMEDQQFIRLVRSDAIDVFVECSGFSPRHRFIAMAGRCAPVQISYLNHAGTSGTPNIDYVLADELSLRKEEDVFFSESVFRLPGSFFCFDFEEDYHPEPDVPAAKENGYVTFGCFGSQGKINKTLISWWAEILKNAPGSRLHIRNRELTPLENRIFLQNCFQKHGIGSHQLIIGGGLERNEIIKCYSSVDISLDTWPYCGGNTVAESLWQGVPVVTYRGQRFSSSYGSSLVAASGCSELIANSDREYVELAVRLSQDIDRLTYYRKNLRSLTRKHGFNNSKAFAENLEKAFLSMVDAARDNTQGL